jgi:hypothetical protein
MKCLCIWCGRSVNVTKKSTLASHKALGTKCGGSGQPADVKMQMLHASVKPD